MVKGLKKPNKLQSNLFLKELEPNSNTINSVNFPSKKPKSQIDKDHYQKHREKKKAERRKRYQQQKELATQTEHEQLSKYYGAEAIKVLMSFKQYIELNPAKKKLWQDFNWTLKDCQEAIKEGLGDITAIMKLEQVANKLVRDYWETAKNEEKQKGKSWNSLDYDGRQRLIKYWGRQKANIENGYIDEDERLERQGHNYLKEIERAKFHEERGKIKCQCSWCQYEAEIHEEVKAKIKKEEKEAVKFWEGQEKKWQGKEKDDNETEWEDGECAECYEYKKVSTESGLCRKCEREVNEGYSED